MNDPARRDGKRTAIVLGLAGIVIEVATVLLFRVGQISSVTAKPLVIVGMLMAFVPLFVVARRARRR